MGFQNISSMKRFSAEKYQKVNLFETELTAMDVYCLMPGQSQKLHSHKGTDKYYLIWEGNATVQIGQETRELTAGEAALARPGVDHSISNHSQEPVVAVVFQAPKSF
ncbi:MAG TPA: cupin domain-containing protein [Symbiobacteriaceae bacterium]|nr:cupin domain-containing protein [Symbiobacteriaceae bacterium]